MQNRDRNIAPAKPAVGFREIKSDRNHASARHGTDRFNPRTDRQWCIGQDRPDLPHSGAHMQALIAERIAWPCTMQAVVGKNTRIDVSVVDTARNADGAMEGGLPRARYCARPRLENVSRQFMSWMLNAFSAGCHVLRSFLS
ncbi:MAG: hypothetical protein ACI9DC_004691 [Gammaproteobacteria bacterium]|jgi:hypothetical protein